MQPGSGEPLLAVDYGAGDTVAVLVWPGGGWVRLMFDGLAVLPSAVYRAADGTLLAGAQAWRRADADPDRMVEMPPQAGIGTVRVDSAELPVADLVTAALRRVDAEATAAAGEKVPAVRMVVPAWWGPRHKTWLRAAAGRAGLGQPQLVEAPVAAAQRLLALGTSVPVGALLLICDVGAGFEASVVRRNADRMEVLSTVADPDAGGARVDDRLLSTLPPAGPAGDGAGSRWAVLAAVRQAKQTLSQLPAVTVALPPPRPAVVWTAAIVDEVAGPVLARAGEVALAAVTAADVTVDQLAGVYCVGAAAAMPTVPRVLGERLGVTPQVVDEPGFAAVLGAADAAGAPAAASPAVRQVPPWRRLVTMAVPGVASLLLYLQVLATAEFNNGSRVYQYHGFYVIVDWGELAFAAVFAVIGCLAFSWWFAMLLASSTRVVSTAAEKAPEGILAAAAAGTAITLMYSIFAAVYLIQRYSSPVRWALLPALPVALAAAGIAGCSAWRRRRRRSDPDWDAILAFPVSSTAFAATGELMLCTALHTPVTLSQQPIIWAVTRVAALLIGVGIACALARTPAWRLIIGVPVAVFLAAVMGPTSVYGLIGLLGVAYALAAAVWWVRRLAEQVTTRTPAQPADASTVPASLSADPAADGGSRP